MEFVENLQLYRIYTVVYKYNVTLDEILKQFRK